MIKIKNKGVDASGNIECSIFPDGSLNMNIIEKCIADRNFYESYPVQISWFFENNEEIVKLQFLVNHLRDIYCVKEINLYVPYLPFARMDRTEHSSEVFTLKYFCKIINELKFNKVISLDVHSNTANAILNNFENIKLFSKDVFQTKFDCFNCTKNISCGHCRGTSVTFESMYKKICCDWSIDMVCYPDEGSAKKKRANIDIPICVGSKVRDWDTHEILEYNISPHSNNTVIDGKNILIVDDICSYGTTFNKCSEALKKNNANDIVLWVTHCENSILESDVLKYNNISAVYTTNSIFSGEHEKIKVMNVLNFEI